MALVLWRLVNTKVSLAISLILRLGRVILSHSVSQISIHWTGSSDTYAKPGYEPIGCWWSTCIVHLKRPLDVIAPIARAYQYFVMCELSLSLPQLRGRVRTDGLGFFHSSYN